MNAEINAINRVFQSQRVRAKVAARFKTPGVYLYGIQIHDEERIKKIENVMPEIELALCRVRPDDISDMVRLQYPPIVIEVPRPDPQIITWPDLLPSKPHSAVIGRGYALGKATDQIVELDDSPHILIASITGGGKSILEVGIALSLALATPPTECRFVLVDLKNRALVPLRKLPHVDRFANDDETAMAAVQYVHDEVLRRRNAYETPSTRMVLIIDELAQMPKDAKPLISKITALGRELKINVIAATQYPTADTLGGGAGKTNYTTSLAGRVRDATAAHIATGRPDSGAQYLPGRGEFLRVDENGLRRFRGYMLSQQQITRASRKICQEWATVPTSQPVTPAQPETPAMPPELATLAELAAEYYDSDRRKWRHGTKITVLRAVFGDDVPIGGNQGKIYVARLANMMEKMGNFPNFPQSYQW